MENVMTFSLYSATIPSYLQMLGTVSGLLDKAEAFCIEQAIDPADIVQARLAEDMLPFAYQVKSTAVHSLGALEGVRAGLFSPENTPPPEDFAGLRARVAETTAAIEAVEAAEVDAWIGQDMRFSIGDWHFDFTAENFLLSFSLPNFYFHVATAYDILRWKGVPIGKIDYVGRLRTKM
jgi:uncharacterized protein